MHAHMTKVLNISPAYFLHARKLLCLRDELVSTALVQIAARFYLAKMLC